MVTECLKSEKPNSLGALLVTIIWENTFKKYAGVNQNEN